MSIHSPDDPMNHLSETWIVEGVVGADTAVAEMTILLDTLPKELSSYLCQHHQEDLINMNEISLQIGLLPKLILTDPQTGVITHHFLAGNPCGEAHIDLFKEIFHNTNDSSSTKRKGIPKTLHRMSVITRPDTGKVLSLIHISEPTRPY